MHGSRVPTTFANEPCLRTDDHAKSAALEAPLLLALDDTDFVAGGLCAASSVQAAMRFWLHGHNELTAHVTRCASASSAACCWSRMQCVLESSWHMHSYVLHILFACCRLTQLVERPAQQ